MSTAVKHYGYWPSSDKVQGSNMTQLAESGQDSKPSMLLDLPPELRLIIYEYCTADFSTADFFDADFYTMYECHALLVPLHICRLIRAECRGTVLKSVAKAREEVYDTIDQALVKLDNLKAALWGPGGPVDWDARAMREECDRTLATLRIFKDIGSMIRMDGSAALCKEAEAEDGN